MVGLIGDDGIRELVWEDGWMDGVHDDDCGDESIIFNEFPLRVNHKLELNANEFLIIFGRLLFVFISIY